MEIGDHVIPVLQDPIERMRVRDEAGAVGRFDQLLDQFVDERALDAEEVAAALLVGRFRSPIVALLVARRQRLSEYLDGHVVVEGLHPFFVLRVVYCADPGGHAHAFQILRKGQHDPFHLRIAEQDFEFERLAGLIIDELLVLEAPPRFLQQLQRLTQAVADIA